MDPQTVQGLAERGHVMEVINDSYQDFGSGQFIWRVGEEKGDTKVTGYVAASDSRRDGLAAGF
jgi:gamma-glutamyltranspeptidase/glutathione hydrolase